MKESRQSFLIGLVSIVALIGLAFLLFLFGELDRVLVRSYEVVVNTDDAAGLRSGSTIMLNGVRIGRVGEVTVATGPDAGAFPVRIVAMVEREHGVPGDPDVRIERSLLGGSAVLAFYGTDPAAGMLPSDGTAALDVPYLSPVDQAAEAINKHLGPLEGAVASFEEMTTEFASLGRNLNALLAAPDADAPASEREASLQETVVRINRMLDETNEAIALARGWLGDETLQASAHDTLDTARRTMDRYEQLADSLDARADTLATKLATLSDDAGAVLEEVRVLTTLASKGEGSMGELMSNPELYQSLTDAAQQLDQLLVEARLLIGKVMTEGMPIDY